MIIKHVPMRRQEKSRFSRLVSYLTDTQGKEVRVGEVSVTNCLSGTVEAAEAEILATQQMNRRACGEKTYHMLMSFRSGEQVDFKVLKAIEERICTALGFSEHQRMSVVHHDTENLHVHIAVNKIHPTRLTMHEPYFPYRTFAKLCPVLEREFGLERDNHIPSLSLAENKAAVQIWNITRVLKVCWVGFRESVLRNSGKLLLGKSYIRFCMRMAFVCSCAGMGL